MCGISGAWCLKQKNDGEALMKSSLHTLRHRGPDDSGIEQFKIFEGSLLLGHVRLSIIDLSAAGHQPMYSEDQRFCMVYNGEIYNYKELRSELKQLGHSFHTETDTEVLIASYKHWGEACLPKFQGMFAFAIYDQEEKNLFCARDAFGIKPFYYEFSGDSFLFSSEIPALLQLSKQKTKLNLERSMAYLLHGVYDTTEDTFIEGVKRLKPGFRLKLNFKKASLDTKQWWKPTFKTVNQWTYPQAVEAVREQFLENVKLHLRSDVKLGAALSGGIDSSAIVGAMRYLEPNQEINTFSYIASGSTFSEEAWIDQVNTFTKAIPHKVTADTTSLFTEMDTLIKTQGEPFGSTSIFAQYKVFEAAKSQGITVLLEGQGADELLAGYTGFPGQRIYSLIEERKFREALHFLNAWSMGPGRSKKMALKNFNKIYFGDRLYQSYRSLMQKNTPDWINADYLKKQDIDLRYQRPPLERSSKARRVMEQMAFSIETHGLPHLLRHGDRNSMHFNLEGRVPFLTTKFADLLFSMPEEYLISRDGESKHVFRAALRGLVPNEILDRKDKIGFVTPEKNWMQELAPQIRVWLEGADRIPILNKKALLLQFDQIMNGKQNYSWQVWRWVNFIRWFELMEFEDK